VYAPKSPMGLQLDGAGEFATTGVWPTGLPAGFSLFWQMWVVDAGGPQNFAASNGLLSKGQ